eukprot:COSAG02_NODE_4474_length_5324_cov_19.463028_6_plen_78_part_00
MIVLNVGGIWHFGVGADGVGISKLPLLAGGCGCGGGGGWRLAAAGGGGGGGGGGGWRLAALRVRKKVEGGSDGRATA